MSLVDLIMPRLGESITEATILKWLKKPGDHVLQDEALLEIATDKVDSEVPSTAEGILEDILYTENDVVPVGKVIAKIRVSTPVDGNPAEPRPQIPGAYSEYEEVKTADEVPYQPLPASSNGSGIRFYSPLVLTIAASEGIPMSELEKLQGTGQDGRVSKRDILQYIAQRKRTPQPSREVSVPSPPPEPVAVREVPPSEPQRLQLTDYSGNADIIEMDRMRRMIAKNMVESRNISAHVTSFAECDVTNMVLWRENIRHEFEKRENEKITFTPLFVEAIVKCIKKYPWLNSSVEGDRIIVKKDINIGMATAMPNGNLIVPVIKNADQLNLVGLTKQVNGLANAARNNKLRPDDTLGGTFTLTNVGTFGSIMGTPIINQPQVAIMATGAIKKRPVVIETAQGDSIAIRHMMYISLSYDHRIIDGALGSTFLNAVAKELENFDGQRSI